MKKRFSWLIMLTTLSVVLSAQETPGLMPAEEYGSDSITKKDNGVNMYFNEIHKDRITGSVNYIDAESEFTRDSRLDLGSAINGKVPGVFDAYNTWGTGNAVVVIDGVPQGEFYYQNLNLMEIESITVLKDAISKAMFGATGRPGGHPG